jgi:hypothetical protein
VAEKLDWKGSGTGKSYCRTRSDIGSERVKDENSAELCLIVQCVPHSEHSILVIQRQTKNVPYTASDKVRTVYTLQRGAFV